MWPFNNNNQRDFIQSISGIPETTPDLPVLMQNRRQPLFACDDLMDAHQGKDFIRGCSTKIARGYTRNKFDYRIHSDSGIGVPLTGNKNSNPLRIKGEIHSVSSDCFKLLDFAYGNGVAYHRTKVGILVPDRMFKTFQIGDEEAIRSLPPGSIKTYSERGLRRYVSDPRVCIVSAWMYIAKKDYWLEHIDGGYEFPKADIHEPKQRIEWLPRYYKYPINMNRTNERHF